MESKLTLESLKDAAEKWVETNSDGVTVTDEPLRHRLMISLMAGFAASIVMRELKELVGEP